jgi:hypothetical protein
VGAPERALALRLGACHALLNGPERAPSPGVELDGSRRRGARILGEILGWSSTASASAT